MLRFDNHVVLVTGASKGIGAAVAYLFGRLGAKIAVHYHLDAAGAERVAAAAGRSSRCYQADLSDWDAAVELVSAVEHDFGHVDIGVLNHGIWKAVSVEMMREVDYDEMLDVNLRGVFALSGALAASMRKTSRRGSLVYVASTAGQRGVADLAHYAASKAAVIALTRSLALELARDGIRVNCVAPGWVATPMTQATLEDAKEYSRIVASIPLGRVATPEEIAGPIVFLASELAKFITGAIVNVDGGG